MHEYGRFCAATSDVGPRLRFDDSFRLPGDLWWQNSTMPLSLRVRRQLHQTGSLVLTSTVPQGQKYSVFLNAYVLLVILAFSLSSLGALLALIFGLGFFWAVVGWSLVISCAIPVLSAVDALWASPPPKVGPPTTLLAARWRNIVRLFKFGMVVSISAGTGVYAQAFATTTRSPVNSGRPVPPELQPLQLTFGAFNFIWASLGTVLFLSFLYAGFRITVDMAKLGEVGRARVCARAVIDARREKDDSPGFGMKHLHVFAMWKFQLIHPGTTAVAFIVMYFTLLFLIF